MPVKQTVLLSIHCNQLNDDGSCDPFCEWNSSDLTSEKLKSHCSGLLEAYIRQ